MSKLSALAHEVGFMLKEQNATISLVETACGGKIASSLLAVPGASAFFQGGINAYGLKARSVFLGWTEEDTANYAQVLHQHDLITLTALDSGPTEAIVTKLAASLRSSLDSSYCLAESGAAGPGIPSKYRKEIKGPGYCPFAIVGAKGLQRTKTIETGLSDRSENMERFAEEALSFLREVLQEQRQSSL